MYPLNIGTKYRFKSYWCFVPQLDVMSFGAASVSTFCVFNIGLIFDAYPHDEFFLEELESKDLLRSSLIRAVQSFVPVIYISPLDQFTDLVAGLSFFNGDYINTIPALLVGLMAGAEDWAFSEKEASVEDDRGALGPVEGYDHVYDTLFSVVIIYNLIGLVPYQSTATSYIAVTFTLSFGVFTAINIVGSSVGGVKLFGHFFPKGVPALVGPFLVLIELVSYIARGFSLGIRLFANMLAGHALLKILASFSWALTKNYGALPFIVLPWIIVFSVSGLELLIAYLQSYVFATLSTIYTQDVVAGH